MVITDRYDHVIDDKNRLAIPSQVRNAMDVTLDGTAFYLVPEGRYLQLIPEKLYHQLAGLATAGLNIAPDIAKARRLMFATASRLECDKAGRCIIPDRFLADRKKDANSFGEAILGREVTLVGVGDRLEIWNRTDLYNHLRELLLDRPAIQAASQQLFTAPPPQTPTVV